LVFKAYYQTAHSFALFKLQVRYKCAKWRSCSAVSRRKTERKQEEAYKKKLFIANKAYFYLAVKLAIIFLL
jgi:hypothetical protein